MPFDTTPPGYTDSTAFPATPTKWKYSAIYRVDDKKVGQMERGGECDGEVIQSVTFTDAQSDIKNLT